MKILIRGPGAYTYHNFDFTVIFSDFHFNFLLAAGLQLVMLICSQKVTERVFKNEFYLLLFDVYFLYNMWERDRPPPPPPKLRA